MVCSVERYGASRYLQRPFTCGSVISCRVHFADSDQNVYKEIRIQELPPPEGMAMNEMRYSPGPGLCEAELQIVSRSMRGLVHTSQSQLCNGFNQDHCRNTEHSA